MMFARPRSLLLLLACISFNAIATPDLKFDVVTFCCGCASGSTCQDQFYHLNWPTTNGHYIAMGTDDHRLELATNGNLLAVYYDTFNVGYSTNSAATQAALIQDYSTSRFTSSGPRPDWIVLNEISSGLWTSDTAYRIWAADVVRQLKTNYGFNVILYSPFPNPANSSSDWQAVAANAYIGIENYLSGTEVKNQSFSVSYCQSAYQSSITSYTNRGVARGQLMLGEHFGQTLSGTSYGRSGVSSNDWDKVIVARDQALLNLAFKGFLSYSWGGSNSLVVTDDERNHFEDTYRTNPLPTNPGVTAPAIVIQPQGQTIPFGGTASFIVFQAGTMPLAYQWRLNGTNISGATTSVLTLTNVDAGNNGSYSVRLTNSIGSLVSSNALLNVSIPPPITFDPFSSATTTYSTASNLIGQTNSAGQYWTQAGPNSALTNQPTILSNSLSFPGLAPSTGNSTKFGGGGGMCARFNLGTNVTAGTLFFSFVCRLADITGLSSTAFFWAGFNNSSGSQTSTPTTVGTRVNAKPATGGYQIGLDKSSGSVASFVFSTNIFTTSDTIFIVASYTFNSGTTTDDVALMWVNPSPSTFGLANPPPAGLTNSAGTDISPIASFVFFNRNAAEPAVIYADELRVGTSWASVTPPDTTQIIIPTLTTFKSGTNVVLSWATNSVGFILESSPALTSSTSWLTVPSPVYAVGGNYVVTNGINGANYFRLRR